MRAPSSFDYAIVRLVPRVERGECLNVGVILFCRTRRFLAARIEVDSARLAAFAPGFDLGEAQEHLDLIPAICAGGPNSGPIGRLPQSERFHWLVAPRSTIIQTSPVHSGLCVDPTASLEHLLATAVRMPVLGRDPGE
ncbi:MAG TPA: DUF3037 domain-containing protein [Chloroflexia bacterium]|nr:DUF3037 domain-containing protein [Chloroflexia bacterium]